MKNSLLLSLLVSLPLLAPAQQLQIHYDFRHTVDPAHNPKNFPGLHVEYFKSNDSTSSFLLKMQTDFNGNVHNPGQCFLQLTQNLRRWQPPVYLSLNYSGGLGIAPPAYGFSIANAFAGGVSYPYVHKRAWFSAALLYRYTTFVKASLDPQINLYFGRLSRGYRFLVAGSFVLWTENRNQGTDFTRLEKGKKFAFFGDPQCWFHFRKGLAVGTRFQVFFHVVTPDNRLQIYPTLALKKQL